MALTKQQQAFVEHYLTCWNGTKAATLAGYSPRSAASQSTRLLKDAEIQAAVKERFDELKMSADEVLIRLTDHARGSMEDFLDIFDNGDARVDLKQAKKSGKLHLVKKYKRSTRDGETTIEFELYDAQNALALLARVHKLLVDRQEVMGELDAKERLASALDRLADRLGAARSGGESDSAGS